jgi:hypothetical protein
LADGEKRRTNRTKEERKAALDVKIAYHEDCIAKLSAAKSKLEEPRKTKTRAKGLKRIISEAKLNDDETAKALGFKSADDLRAKLLKAAQKKAKED